MADSTHLKIKPWLEEGYLHTKKFSHRRWLTIDLLWPMSNGPVTLHSFLERKCVSCPQQQTIPDFDNNTPIFPASRMSLLAKSHVRKAATFHWAADKLIHSHHRTFLTVKNWMPRNSFWKLCSEREPKNSYSRSCSWKLGINTMSVVVAWIPCPLLPGNTSNRTTFISQWICCHHDRRLPVPVFFARRKLLSCSRVSNHPRMHCTLQVLFWAKKEKSFILESHLRWITIQHPSNCAHRGMARWEKRLGDTKPKLTGR